MYQVFAGQLQVPVGAAERERRRNYTFELVEAAALTADHMVDGHSHGLEADGGRIGCTPPNRLDSLDGDPRAVGINHEQREPHRAATAAR